MAILATISEIIRDILDEESLEITEQTQRNALEGWDSMAQIQIVCAIEKDLSIKFTMDELEQLNQMESVGDMISLVSGKTSA
ncbi:acyl carrier protein [Endozoicomonas sp. GU-1]|uniref:acyl carrier protein n=1 Tax=Endozoicomonas sp. GU-1 TaxID=3009078 RepID=UPI0022B423E5|nr:acyl carrier protein [Endozoicomonas sp. GU-1]WBA83055.1 acyl carrier protein [Endozoicomonas sp. GU-1]WBA85977.1 acyl carrier protein [Endozoicomonas sp. GU-1]